MLKAGTGFKIRRFERRWFAVNATGTAHRAGDAPRGDVGDHGSAHPQQPRERVALVPARLDCAQTQRRQPRREQSAHATPQHDAHRLTKSGRFNVGPRQVNATANRKRDATDCAKRGHQQPPSRALQHLAQGQHQCERENGAHCQRQQHQPIQREISKISRNRSPRVNTCKSNARREVIAIAAQPLNGGVFRRNINPGGRSFAVARGCRMRKQPLGLINALIGPTLDES